MALFGVYARFIVEANDPDDASSIVGDMLYDVEGVDEIWTEVMYEDG